MLDFNKRINGKIYYIRVFASLAVLLVIAALFELLPEESLIALILFLPYLLACLFWLVFVISQIRQRANDIGPHPLLITVVTFLTPFAFLVLGLIPGQKHTNKSVYADQNAPK